MGQSEVARIREQIAFEYQASQRTFTDFTSTSRHKFITKRQENIGAYFEELSKLMPPEEAIAIVAETLNTLQSCGPRNTTGYTSNTSSNALGIIWVPPER